MTINAINFNSPIPPTRIRQPQNDDALLYNSATGFFENRPVSAFAGATTFDELQDFVVSDPLLSGDVLVYDGVLKKWTNQDVSLGTPIRFTSLIDTNDLPEPNQYLKWNNFSVLDVDSEIEYVDKIPLADIENLSTTLDQKSDKIIPSSVGNIATLDATGNLVDSGTLITGFATSAQGALADTALQPGDNLSALLNDTNFVVSGSNVSVLSNDSGYIAAVEDDTDPVLSGDLDVNNFEIISAVAGDIRLTLRDFAINNGFIYLNDLRFPNIDGNDGDILTTNGSGILSFASPSTIGGAQNISDLDDVDLTGIDSGDILIWNGTTFLPAPAPSGGGSGSVDSIFGRTGTVLAQSSDYSAFYATLAQGALATTALQPGVNISTLTNDAGYITNIGSIGDHTDVDLIGLSSGDFLSWDGVNFVPTPAPTGGTAPVDSVNSQTGVVVLDADDIDDSSTLHKFVTSAQLSLINDAIQPGDAISVLINDANYLDNSLLGVPSGIATLDVSGKVPTAQLPTFSITDTFVVADEPSMLSTGADTGDIAVRTDESKTYILAGTDPTMLADWQEILSPTSGSVVSVNGYTGVIVLGKSDIGLSNVDNTSDLNKPISIATQAALDLKADKVSGATNGHIAGLDATGNLTDSGFSPSDFATSAQGALADTALQTGASISSLTNDVGFLTTLGSIDGHTDVDLSGVASGHVLIWNGSSFVTQLAPGGGDFFASGVVPMTGKLTINASGDIIDAGDLIVVSGPGGVGLHYGSPGSYNAGVVLNSSGSVQMRSGTGTQAYVTVSGNNTTLYVNGGTKAAESAVPSNGGLFVNNQLTGSGLERVLSTSDQVDLQANIDGKLSSGENVSELANDVGYITSLGSIDGHTDVSITSATTSDVLTWDGASWINSQLSSMSLGSISSHSDVNLSGLTTNDILQYNGTAWVPVELPSGGSGAVDSVNSQTGVVVLDADDIDDTSTINKFVTSGELSLISNAIQPGDNITQLTNDAGYLNSLGSIGGHTDVDLTGLTSGKILEYNGSSFVLIDTPSGGSGGEANTASNLGAGEGVFASKVSEDLQFKSFVAGTNITLSSDGNAITINSTGGSGAVDSVFGRTGVVVSQSGDYSATQISYSNATSGLTATEVQGAIDEIEDRVESAESAAGTAMQPGDNISELSNDSGYISGITAESIGDLSDVNLSGISTNDYLQWNGSAFVAVALSGSGEANTASNLGTGEGVFAQKSSADLQFKSIVGGTNVTVTSDANEVTINSSAGVASNKEYIRIDYNGFGTISGVADNSAGIINTTIISNQWIEFEFDSTKHSTPPIGIIYYGYRDFGSDYKYKMTQPASSSLDNYIDDGGTAGSPAQLLSAMTQPKITLQCRASETFASNGQHAYIFFIF